MNMARVRKSSDAIKPIRNPVVRVTDYFRRRKLLKPIFQSPSDSRPRIRDRSVWEKKLVQSFRPKKVGPFTLSMEPAIWESPFGLALCKMNPNGEREAVFQARFQADVGRKIFSPSEHRVLE
ncbi:MAG: hypothetical protein Q7R47_00915, partial [Candidatus Diapherotrites archaeon]|nr:hypothetical protein [Candidatus Diapherotrites archaeon]